MVDLGGGTFLTGADGWYDGRMGNLDSPFWIRDWDQIEEFQQFRRDKAQILGLARKWADEEARCGARNIRAALDAGAKRVLFVTHIPPFPEVSLYEGRQEPKGQPYYVSVAMGNTLRSLAAARPDVDFEVFCGHTHERASMATGNLRVHAGDSVYSSPRVSALIPV